MRRILRTTVFNAFSLFVISLIFDGVIIHGGVLTYIFGGFVLALISIFIKPIINIVSLPLNLVSLGLFSFITNALILYLLTVIIPQISIRAFTYHGLHTAGFVIPVMHFNTFFAYVITAGMLFALDQILSWATKK